jgi:4-diphosphocytidyl-2-C-methyl-D-erythritol kinase
MILSTRARAKINLTLHVPRRREDGWHELVSLVAFAGCGDHLTLAPGPLSLSLSGPMQAAIVDEADNLVLRAARHLADRVEGLRLGHFALSKHLPVASGIGGGSADAAAALRLVAEANGIALDDPRLMEAAAATGADVPVCVGSAARIMEGRGERLGAPIRLPPLFAVLVNPRQPLETRLVFARMGLRPGEIRDFGAHPEVGNGLDGPALLALLRRTRNDMEDAASGLLPSVGAQIAVLSAARGCRLARMSGSGATCFGLFEDCHAAARAAKAIRRDHPSWWVKATALR